MTIKTMDGESHDVTSQGQGALNTVLGAVGTAGALGLFGNGNGLFGNSSSSSTPAWVSKEEFQQAQTISTLQMEKAQLEAKDYTNTSVIDLYKNEQTQRNADRDRMTAIEKSMYEEREAAWVRMDSIREQLTEKIDANRIAQDAVNAQQAAYNASANGVMATLQSQVEQLQSMTKLVIPSSSVCDTGCSCNCSNN